MYIAVGSSKKYSLHEGIRNLEEDSTEAANLELSYGAEPFVVLKRSPDGKFFVTATSDVLFLWSSKPTVVVSIIHRSIEHVDAEGKNAVVTWRPDSTALAVKTSKSFIHVYELSINDTKEVFNFDFTDNERVHVLQGPGQAKGLRNAELNFKFSVEVEDGVSCLTGLKSDLLVATFQNHRMLSISWAGEVEDCRYDFSFLQEILEPKKVFISEVVYSTRMDLFAFILSDKSIFLSFTKDVSFDVETKNHVLLSPNPQRKAIHFYCTDKNDARIEKASPCTVAVESRFRLIAIGTEEGDVWVYHLNREMQLFLSHKLRCPWTDVSPVQSLNWTSDGHAIAVGWMKNGFSVYTSFGRHLVSCKSEDDEMDSRNRESEEYLNGISSFFWTRGNFGLMINPSSDAVNSPTLFCVPFAKYAVSTCNIRDNMRNPFLIADDRLLIHSGTDVDSSPLSPLSMVWQVVQFPPSYISENWPIRYAASSADGRKIAVAGEYGFALCNMSSGGGKWKLFGSRQHERSFSVLGGVLFHKDLIIVGTEDKLSFANELRVYSTERNLDNSLIMFKETFRSRIIFMNILYNKLLVYTIYNELHQYSISRHRNELKIIKENVFDLKNSIYSPFSVQYIDCYLPMAAETEITEKTPILVLQEGHLEIVDYKGKAIKLADHIEFCWAYFPRRPVGDLFNVLWAFDGECSKVWINLLLKKSRTFFLTHAATLLPLKLSLDFYPLSVLFHKGVVVGVDQYLSRINSLDTACFKSVGKTFLFLPDLVSYLLQRGFFIEAVRYSAYYQEYDYFGHSMEILVHKILDREALRFHKIPQTERFLPIVVQFLRNFPHFHDVIVRCARKTEVAMWDYLFEIVGDPKELFNFCLQEGYLRTATSFLVIIQTLEPSATSGKLQMDLLEKCLEAEEFDLVSEIVRYLTSVSSSANASRPQALNTGTLLAISADEEQTFFIDILISRHIRKLMSGLRVRTAGKLAATLNFPFAEWLHKERYRSCYVKNLKLAFKELHHQFEWPFPSEDNVKHYMSKNKKDVESIAEEDFNTESKGADTSTKNDMTTRRASFDSQSYRRASFSDDTIDFPKHKAPLVTKESGFMGLHSERGDLERELRTLVDVMTAANCYQWALLMSTLVFDLGTAATILRESSKDKEFETLYGDYKSMLQNCGSPEYAKFAASLSELLNLQGYSALLGEKGQPQSAVDTIEKLCDRVVNSTLLEDRRAAILGLKGLSKQYQLDVGTKAMQILLHILHSDVNNESVDPEATKAILDTLVNICSNHNTASSVGSPTGGGSKEMTGTLFTEILVKDPSNVAVLLNLLGESDFHVRYTSVELMKVLLQNNRKPLQDCVLMNPLGKFRVSRLMDLLDDRREVIRNEGLLLLIDLTYQNADIQKIITFESAFERLFQIIYEEGGASGDVIVQDCLQLIQNLLGDNVSNQNYFRESGLVSRICPFFDVKPTAEKIIPLKSSGESILLTEQKVNNILMMLEVIKILLSSDNPNVQYNQGIVLQSGLLSVLLQIGLNEDYPSVVRVQSIFAASLGLSGHEGASDYFSRLSVIPKNQSHRVPALQYVLATTRTPGNSQNQADLAILRQACTVLIINFLYNNTEVQKFILSTVHKPPELNPNDSAAKDSSNESVGRMLVYGLISDVDDLGLLLNSLILSFILRQNNKCREMIIQLKITASEDGEYSHEELYLYKVTNMLLGFNRKGRDLKAQAACFLLLASVLFQNQKAVELFLKEKAYFSFLIELITNVSVNYVIQGFAAFILGICFDSNNDKVDGLTREKIQSILINRVGADQYISRLNKFKECKEVSLSNSLETIVANTGLHQQELLSLFFDDHFLQFLRTSLDKLGKTVVNPKALKEIETAKEESEIQENVINSYKQMIASQDKEIHSLKKQLEELKHNTTGVSPNSKPESGDSEEEMNALKLKHENEINALKDQLKQVKAQELRHETEIKEVKAELEKAKGEIVRLNEELEKSQKDRDDALVFLAEQDVETAQLKEKLKQLGHPVETETEDDYDDDDAQGDEEELVKELIEADI